MYYVFSPCQLLMVDCRKKFVSVSLMKTKIILSKSPKFYFFRKEKDFSLPKFIIPGVWWESRRQGMEISMVRVTIGFWYWRWHCCFGEVTPPPAGPINAAFFQLDTFVQWMNNWASTNATRAQFDSWLLQSEWKTLVRWGGSQYHYSKILLAKEFLNATENQSLDSVNPDPMDIKLTLDDSP